MTLEAIREVLSHEKPLLKSRYGVREIGVFGSYVRGEDTKDSDLDVLVDFEHAISLLRFIELENYLTDLLQVKVDLVMRDALKPRIGQRILKEVITI